MPPPTRSTPTSSDAPPATLPGADPDALAVGRIRTQPLRKAPRVPSWALKVVMAVTGTLFALFVFVHMIGNLKVFTGAEHFNEYAHWLRTVLEPFLPYEGLLWILRIVLLVSLVGHVWAGAVLWRRSRVSRGPHRRKGLRGMRSFSARSMPVTGVVLLGFIVFHVLDLTVGAEPVAPESFQGPTHEQTFAYENLIASFERPVAAGFYIVALLALFFHLAHGLWTVVNDLGATGKRTRAVGAAVGGILALAVLLGNILIPVAVLTGVLS